MTAVWKEDAPYALCLTHDVDRVAKQWYHYAYYALSGVKTQVLSLAGRLRGREPYWNFYRLMEQEMAAGVRSTFFFLNEKVRKPHPAFMGRYGIGARKVCDMIRELDANGFEIGLHGSFYSYKDRETLLVEKQRLEDILGHAVVSTRQHYLHLEEGMTWRIQREIGLRYDSSLGYADRPGGDLPFPFRTAEGMLELPITLMDTVPMRGGRERADIRVVCDACKKQGGLIVLNFHQCHYSDLEYPQHVEVFSEILRDALADRAWIAPMGEIGGWLDARLQ